MQNAFGYELLEHGIIKQSTAWTADNGSQCEGYLIEHDRSHVDFVVLVVDGNVVSY